MEKIQINILVPAIMVRAFTNILCLYRRCRYGYAFRMIPLTRGKFAVVSPQDYNQLNKYKWHTHKSMHTFYAYRTKQNHGKKTAIPMHRQIINPPANLLVDHINHDGLDNRRENLRFATYCQNNSNTRKMTTGSSKYKGVSWNKQTGRWYATIRTGSRGKFLGSFDDEKRAAHAYDAAAKKLRGDFAYLNFS